MQLAVTDSVIAALYIVALVAVACLVSLLLAVVISLAQGGRKKLDAGFGLDTVSFSTGQTFNISGVGVMLVLAALYITWW